MKYWWLSTPWVLFRRDLVTPLVLHQTMMTSSNGNIFRVTGHLCGEFTGPGEFPAQRPVTRSFDVSFDLRLDKQRWGWWFETLSRPLCRHRNALLVCMMRLSCDNCRTSYISRWKMYPMRLITILMCMTTFFRMVAGVAVKLTDKNIWSIPPQLRNPPTSIHILTLNECTNLTRLVNNSFITYPNLERLFVYGSDDLEIIEEGAFNGLFLLQRIKFSPCKLIQFPKLPQPSIERIKVMGFSRAFAIRPQFQYPHFRGFPKLKDLDLTAVKPINFTGSILPATLLKLFLYDSGVTEMPDFSRYTPDITQVTLARNPIGDFPIERITGLAKLTVIRLDGCSLTSLEFPPESTLVSLKKIVLNDNQLKTISGLSYLPKLKTLELENNNLTSLPDVFHLPAVDALKLGGNPWECGQHLCWLWALLFTKPTVIDANSPLNCTSPPLLAGRDFLSLREEDLGCQVANFGKYLIFLKLHWYAGKMLWNRKLEDSLHYYHWWTWVLMLEEYSMLPAMRSQSTKMSPDSR